ncbi:MAG: response regulator [Betaproteobacteria bacterium]
MRNPLAALSAAAHVLKVTDPSREPSIKARAVIERQIRHMARLIADLLDIGRISAGELGRERERLDLAEAVARVITDLRLALQLALEAADYAVEVAASGQETLAAQRRQPADILVTDIFMPESDGFEAIEGFRREFPSTKIVAVSGGGGRAKLDYLRSARLVGAAATLQKPFEVGALLQTLRTL